MEAVETSEMSAYFNETTQHYIPKGSHLHSGGPRDNCDNNNN